MSSKEAEKKTLEEKLLKDPIDYGMRCSEKNLKKVSGYKQKITSKNNQVILRVSRIITTQTEEVNYYPLPAGVNITDKDFYDYKIEAGCLAIKSHINPIKKYVEPFPKNCEDTEERIISKKSGAWKFSFVKSTYIDIIYKLFKDMVYNEVKYDFCIKNCPSAKYDNSAMFRDYYATSHDEDFEDVDICKTGDELYDYIQKIL